MTIPRCRRGDNSPQRVHGAQGVWTAADDLRLRAALEDAFTELALHPAEGRSGEGIAAGTHPARGARPIPPLTGHALATALGYAADVLEALPLQAVASFSGVGNPFAHVGLPSGVTVLDVGCGSGTDLLIAAGQVGREGHVIGIDMTPDMVERALECVGAARRRNVRVEWGHAESLPLPEASVDLVMTNGALTLSLDERGALRELARVLKPGGRLLAVEVLVESPEPRPVAGPAETDAFRTWIWGVAGGLVERELRADLEAFGFRRARFAALGPATHRVQDGTGAKRVRASIAEVRAVRR